MAKRMGFVKEGLLETALEEGSTDLASLAPMAALTTTDMQVLRLLFDEKTGGSIDGPLNWYRCRKVHHEEDKG